MSDEKKPDPQAQSDAIYEKLRTHPIWGPAIKKAGK
jgi:hypothetical protein